MLSKNQGEDDWSTGFFAPVNLQVKHEQCNFVASQVRLIEPFLQASTINTPIKLRLNGRMNDGCRICSGAERSDLFSRDCIGA